MSDEDYKFFSNEKVSASAGSGKTFALTTRFIAIACSDVDGNGPDPFSIIALTFTKKAAGEFMAKILQRLADGASSQAGADKLAKEIMQSVPEPGFRSENFTRARFCEVLRLCAKNLDKLHLGTIDSLFSSIIMQNANALRIFEPVEIVDENSVLAREFTLLTITDMMSKFAVSQKNVEELAEILKQSSFGKETKNSRDLLLSIIKKSHKQYLECKDLNLWGNPELSGVRIKKVDWDPARYAKLMQSVAEDLGGVRQFAGLLKFLQNSDASILNDDKSAALRKVCQAKCDGTLAQTKSLEIGRALLPLPCAQQIDEMLDMLAYAHFQKLCRAARALGAVAALYESSYESQMRSKGKITFSDMPYILTDPSRETDIQIIQYKLDAKFKHWLFDEFQDTSAVQWRALENLVEEAIVDPLKSFYYVGDIKQSIYSWRGATPELFNEISNRYNKNRILIRKAKPLKKSYRSGEYVIRAVNKIFGDKAQLARAFTEEPAEIFSGDFSDHISAETDPSSGKKPRPSYARLSLYKASQNDEDDMAQVCQKILQIIRQTKPLERGISCAVLVYKNSHIKAIVDFLKGNGYPAVGEMAENIAEDRPLVSLFTAVLKGVAHPENSASRAYCDMANILDFTDDFSAEFCAKAICKIYSGGFEAFADEYIAYMQKFGNAAAAEFRWLKEACGKLDASGVCSIDEAVLAIADSSVKTSADASVIEVMTIHKSKGLAFSMTIVPVKNKIRARDGLMPIGQSIMPCPDKKLAQLNADLLKAYEVPAKGEKFEALCKYYVSMTRAERALYILAPQTSTFFPKTAGETSFVHILLNAFVPEMAAAKTDKDAKKAYEKFVEIGGEAGMGDPLWFEQFAKEAAPAKTRAPHSFKLEKIPQKISVVRPSKASKSALGDEKLADFGTRIHGILSTVRSLKTIPEFGDSQAREALTTLFENPDFRGFFDVENAYCANEFSFECALENKNIARGLIDRIVAKREGDNFESIKIIDYKPTTFDSGKHAQQLKIYAECSAKIFGVNPEKISCYIAGYLDGKVSKII